MKSSWLETKVFKPGPRLGFRILIGSSGFDRVGRVNSYFKKISKRRRFSKKKKVNGLQPVFWPGQPAGSTGSWLMLFFHQPGPVPTPGRSGPGSTRWAGPGFKTLLETVHQGWKWLKYPYCKVDDALFQRVLFE